MSIFLINVVKLEYVIFDKLCDVQTRSLKIEIVVNIIIEIINVMYYTTTNKIRIDMKALSLFEASLIPWSNLLST